MATGEASLGLVGLTHNVNKRESARQDLATMGQLYQMKKQQEAEEQQAALVEQQYYEQIQKQADQMLAGDRKRINEKAKSLQGQIREQIKAFGGSRAKFMASGGVAMIGDYTRNVLESKEVALYKQNKINLEKLLDIKEKGMGGQISSKDELSLNEYMNNGYGEITYNGLKNVVELPAEANYYEGQYATPMDILLYKNNKAKILANYKIDNPDSNIETLPDYDRELILRQYTNLNYSVRGSKTRPIQSNTGTGNNRTGKNGEDPYSKATVGGELYLGRVKYNKPLTVEDMKSGIQKSAPYLTDLVGTTKWNRLATIEPTILSEIKDTAAIVLGNNVFWDYDQDNTYKARGAVDMGASLKTPMWQLQNGNDYVIEGGVIKDLDPSTLDNLKWANGAPVTPDKLKKLEKKKGNWKLIGAFAGYTMDAQGQEYLVTDAYTNDGLLNEKKTESMYINDDPNSEMLGKFDYYIALENEDKEVLYQKVNYDGINQANMLGTYLKEANDLSDQYLEDKYNDEGIKNAQDIYAGSTNSQAIMDVPNEIFDNYAPFLEQVKHYNGNIDTSFRSNLLKGFYTAMFDRATSQGMPVDFEKMIENDPFGSLLYGLGLDQKIKDYRISDMDFLDYMRQTILNTSNSGKPEELESNKNMMNKIRAYMIKASQPQSKKTKAEQGANFGFTPGSEWEIVKDFEGPSHEGGGIDVNVNNL